MLLIELFEFRINSNTHGSDTTVGDRVHITQRKNKILLINNNLLTNYVQRELILFDNTNRHGLGI